MLEEIIDLARTLDQRLVLLNNLGAHAAMLLGRGQPVQAELALKQLELLLADIPQAREQ